MGFGAILLLALGLAVDATAASATRGLATPRILPRHVFLVVVFFGGFQALMPLIGWGVGSWVGPLVQAWDHWIAFVLLSAIGGKMLWEARKKEEAGEEEAVPDPFGLKIMFLLAIATSIDALAVGLSFAFLDVNVGVAVAAIGLVTFALSFVAVFVGYRIGTRFRRPAEILGGLVLIGIGTQILIEHLTAG